MDKAYRQYTNFIKGKSSIAFCIEGDINGASIM